MKEYTEIVRLREFLVSVLKEKYWENFWIFDLSFEEKKMWSWKDAMNELAWRGQTLFPAGVLSLAFARSAYNIILQVITPLREIGSGHARLGADLNQGATIN